MLEPALTDASQENFGTALHHQMSIAFVGFWLVHLLSEEFAGLLGWLNPALDLENRHYYHCRHRRHRRLLRCLRQEPVEGQDAAQHSGNGARIAS